MLITQWLGKERIGWMLMPARERIERERGREFKIGRRMEESEPGGRHHGNTPVAQRARPIRRSNHPGVMAER